MIASQLLNKNNLRICGHCLQYIFLSEITCPLCGNDPKEKSMDYINQNFSTTELIWKIERQIEKIQMIQKISLLDNEVSNDEDT